MTVLDTPRSAAVPGLAPENLVRLMRRCVAELRIDLSGAVVLTEAATGAYAVTPVLAALAGAECVIGRTASTRHGTVEEVRAQTRALARAAGVGDRVLISTDPTVTLVSAADVVTNSGHLRPLDAAVVAAMKSNAVVPLMFEAWEIQAGRFDVDLAGLRHKGIGFAGTNERHPLVNVFSHLAAMAGRQLLESGTAVLGARIALLCDNPFASYLEEGLSAAGAQVRTGRRLSEFDPDWCPDVVLVSLTPTGRPLTDAAFVDRVSAIWPGTLVAQFWGDLDRSLLDRAGIRYWPVHAPAPGHMGVLMSDGGVEPVVRLQAGGLKVASVLRTSPDARTAFDLGFVDGLD